MLLSQIQKALDKARLVETGAGLGPLVVFKEMEIQEQKYAKNTKALADAIELGMSEPFIVIEDAMYSAYTIHIMDFCDIFQRC